MNYVTFLVHVEGRVPFVTRSVLLARAYADLHDNATTETGQVGRNWPVPRDPEFAQHRAVRRAAMAWRTMDRAILKFDDEIKTLPPGPQTSIRDRLAYDNLFTWLLTSRATLRDEVYALSARSGA